MINAQPSGDSFLPFCPITSTARARELATSAERDANLRSEKMSLTAPLDDLRALLAETPLFALSTQTDAAGIRTLAHTIDLNTDAVEYIFQRARDPLELAYAVALITQKSMHTFTNPADNGRMKNLTGAKRAGTFFTPPRVAVEMAELGLAGRAQITSSLEPAAGTGMLSAAFLVVASQKNIPVSSVHAWELSPYLARLAHRVLTATCALLEIDTQILVQSGDAVDLFNKGGTSPEVILLNPPYGRVKYLRSEATNAETRAKNVSAAVAVGKEWVDSTRARYSALATRVGLRNSGLDHQSVFIAASFDALAPSGRLVCIAPSAWTSGAQSADLRRILLPGKHVENLILYSEDSKLFPTVNQPTAVATVDKAGGHDVVTVATRSAKTNKDGEYRISYDEILSATNESLVIPLISASARSAHEQMRSLPRVADISSVKNARGELDLSLDAWMLSDAADGARVVRGDHIQRHHLLDPEASSKPARIGDRGLAALRTRPKWADVVKPRIVGRQVAYMGKKRRLTFALVPEDTVVANSCNYISVDNATTRDALLGYLNSAPAEWWFRAHSSNNHVSNGEIDGLPWPLADPAIEEALAAASQIRRTRAIPAYPHFAERVDVIIDALICLALGLNAQSAKVILTEVLDPPAADETIALLDWFYRWGVPRHLRSSSTWLQHEPNTLSALDMEMIRHIPIGGNWQNIPESVPSERVKQIRAMSAERGIVRTTYYGRLRPDQPAYTIATYFNRPGNGTNIHPIEDRTISSREAARFQSFPDTYGFIGSDGAIRKQIGNAVPPLLAQAVAQKVFESGNHGGPVVDLFAGAGGLSLGFELAGARVAVAVDNEPAALKTYAFNRPTESLADPASTRTLLIEADLSSQQVREEVFAAVRQKLAGESPSVLVGGPPCQGFSYAGFRDPTDPRSDLAVAFLDFVEALRPGAVVLENVEGLLTAQKGRVVEELIRTLDELGYPVVRPWVLAAEQFGVPQMRRRVFLVAQKGDTISAPEGFFDRCLGRREPSTFPRDDKYPITAQEAVHDLPTITGQKWSTAPSRRVSFSAWARGEKRVPNFSTDA